MNCEIEYEDFEKRTLHFRLTNNEIRLHQHTKSPADLLRPDLLERPRPQLVRECPRRPRGAVGEPVGAPRVGALNQLEAEGALGVLREAAMDPELVAKAAVVADVLVPALPERIARDLARRDLRPALTAA